MHASGWKPIKNELNFLFYRNVTSAGLFITRACYISILRFLFCFSQTKALFLCLFSTLPQYNIQKKPLDNYEKVLLFLHTTIIANYRHCTNIQIHRCGRRFEQQTGICYSKGTQRLHVVSYPRRHRPIQRKRIQAVQTDGWR